MDRQFGEDVYRTAFLENLAEGFAGLQLIRIRSGDTKTVASMIFWDASGEYFVETLGADVPLPILEELIDECREVVPTK